MNDHDFHEFQHGWQFFFTAFSFLFSVVVIASEDIIIGSISISPLMNQMVTSS